ncbi:MAG: hypothetical protein K8U57_08680 [Planctomycetes bacterium]|nr:hypothetical protein [Planctomycetota bacterium]
MAKKKADESKTEAAPESAEAPAEKITQRVAVERALKAGKDSPTDGVAYVKEQFGISLNNGSFSTIKSQLKKAGEESKPAGKPGRPAGVKAAPVAKPVATVIPNMALQVEAIKTLVETLGVDQVVSIARLFAK